MKKNILVCSAGRRVSLVSYFMKEAKSVPGKETKVYTTDLDPEMSAACRISDGGFKVGRFGDADYIDSILDLCKKQAVGLVIPTIDTELKVLAENAERFAAAGINLIVSDLSFVKICRDKHLMNAFFAKRGFLVPATIDIAKPVFPVFIKPVSGSSSKDIYLVKNAGMLSEFMCDKSYFMHMEYLSPTDYTEYTVDLYYDKASNLKCVVPRVRLAVRGGETNKGITVKNELCDIIEEKLGHIEGARGCLTLQVFFGKENKKIYGIEINPRFGGGYPLSYLAGANYPAWLIKEYLLQEKIDRFDAWEDKLLLLRYDHELTVSDYEI